MHGCSWLLTGPNQATDYPDWWVYSVPPGEYAILSSISWLSLPNHYLLTTLDHRADTPNVIRQLGSVEEPEEHVSQNTHTHSNPVFKSTS